MASCSSMTVSPWKTSLLIAAGSFVVTLIALVATPNTSVPAHLAVQPIVRSSMSRISPLTSNSNLQTASSTIRAEAFEPALPTSASAPSSSVATVAPAWAILLAPVVGAAFAIFNRRTSASPDTHYVMLAAGAQDSLAANPLWNSNSRRPSTALAMGKGPFGWLENNVPGKEEMFEAQQRIIEARRSGRSMEGVKERRERVSKFMRKELPPEEMARIKAANEAKAKKMSQDVKGGIPLPMASFGMPEFDGGERFDLRLPYVDEGWVDPNYKGPFDWLPWNKDKKKKEADKTEK